MKLALELRRVCVLMNSYSGDEGMDRNPALRVSLPDPAGHTIHLDDLRRRFESDLQVCTFTGTKILSRSSRFTQRSRRTSPGMISAGSCPDAISRWIFWRLMPK